MEKDNNNSFNYTYSASRQSEIDEIRKKYIPREEDKMEKLRRLDKGAEQKGTIISIIIGVISTLVLGIGMCCTMVWTDYFVPGIIVGIIGIAGVSAAFPIYKYLVKIERKKIAPEILRLTEELSNGV